MRVNDKLFVIIEITIIMENEAFFESFIKIHNTAHEIVFYIDFGLRWSDGQSDWLAITKKKNKINKINSKTDRPRYWKKNKVISKMLDQFLPPSV